LRQGEVHYHRFTFGANNLNAGEVERAAEVDALTEQSAAKVRFHVGIGDDVEELAAGDTLVSVDHPPLSFVLD
jgi:hypothetical protein